MPTPPALDHLLSVSATVEAPQMLPGAPHGTVGVINVVGGSFEGPRLRGRVVPPGGDWFTVRASGALEVDARLTLLTDDDVVLVMAYAGIAVTGDGGMGIRVAPRFTAPEGPYSWLNDLQAVAAGRVGESEVIYDVYALA